MIDMKETELNSQNQLLSTIQSKVTGSNGDTFESTVTLQKMVPVKPLSQQLLLEIEKAEVVSGSFVVNMAFEDEEVTKDSAKLDEEQSENAESTEENGSPNEENSEGNSTSLPAGVKKIIATLTVESPSYFEFEEFIRTLESSERIIVVESIDFTAGEEIIEVEQKSMPLSYQVILSAFYMPTLTDLIDKLPKMETPAPANKKNPLPSFGEYSNVKSEYETKTGSTKSSENNKEKNQEASNTEAVDRETRDQQNEEKSDASNRVEGVAQADNNKKTNSDFQAAVSEGQINEKYIVKTGDSLFKIAMKFYKSQYGIQKIKDANNLNDDSILIGQELIIPKNEN